MDKASRQIEINAPVEAVFDLFSGFNHFPRWMKGVKRVEHVTAGRTRWTMEAPDGTRGEWEAEIVELEPGRRATWRSTGGDVTTEGEASFEKTERGTTLLRLTLGYAAPEQADESIAAALNRDLGQRLEDDLLWFRLYAERETRASSGTESGRRTQSVPLPAFQPNNRADRSSAHFNSPSSVYRAGQMNRSARVATSFLSGAEVANRRRGAYSPIIVKIDQPVSRPDDDATVLIQRRRALVPASLRRPVIACVMLGLLFVTGAGLLRASRWPSNPNTRHAEALPTAPAGLPTGSAQYDKPSTAAGIEPTATFGPDVPPELTAEPNPSPPASTAKPQQKTSAKREKQSRASWLTGWIKPVIKPFVGNKKAADKKAKDKKAPAHR